MNRERAKELLPIIRAYAEGKIIQAKGYNSGEWFDTHSQGADFFDDDREFRIKPEPEVIWVNKWKDGFNTFNYPSYYEAMAGTETCKDKYEYIAKKFIACE